MCRLSALDDDAEVGTDDAQGVTEVDRDEEGLVDVDVGDHDAEGDAHQVDVGDIDDVAGFVRRGDRAQGQGDRVLVQGEVGVGLDGGCCQLPRSTGGPAEFRPRCLLRCLPSRCLRSLPGKRDSHP